MRRKSVILKFFVVLMFVAFSQQMFSQLQWREVNHTINTPSLIDTKNSEGIEIYAKDKSIISRTTKKEQVKVFTILGQLVSNATINQGLYELKIDSRGIYIVKIGNVTQKVAL